MIRWAWLVVAMLALHVAVARAAPDDLAPEPAAELQAPFALHVNSVEKGEIVVLLRNGQVFAKRADLIDAGIRVPDGVEIEADGQRYLSLQSVSPPLSYELDEEDIALHIVAPAELLPSTMRDLTSRPPAVSYPRRISGFVNYAPRVDETGRVEMYEETAVSFDGHLLSSSAYLSSTRRPVRGVTSLELNDRDTLTRTTLGDALVSTGTLGSGHFLGGATVASAFDLDPYVVKVPSIGYAGSTLTPATVDVYVNGARVRSEEVQPGTFRLDNLRVGGGAGIAKYVIRDVFGHEQTVTMPFYVSDSVLRRGLQQYAYSLGVLRSGVGQRSWDYGAPAVLGRHRVGVSDHITLGARAEASGPVVSLGPTLTTMTPLGQIELDFAASRDTSSGTGLAGFASYGYVSRWFGAGVYCHLTTNTYATIDTRGSIDRATLELGAYQSVPIGQRVTFTTQGTFSRYRDRGTQLRGGAQLAVRVGARAQALLSASQAKNTDGQTPWEVMLTLNVAFEGGHNTTASGRVMSGEPALSLDASKSLPVGEGYGYRASGVIAQTNSATALAQYQTLYGRYGVQYDYYAREHHVTADAVGAIAVVPGVGVFPTLPVQGGFGVIRVPGVANVRGYVNNQELGTTDRNGNLLVPHLLSYYGNRLGIAQEDVPIRYSLAVTELTLAPPSRGVAVAEFPLRVPHFYRGRIAVDEHGTRVVPKYGQVRVAGAKLGEEVVSPLGAQGEFELDGVTAGRRTLAVDYAGGTCEVEHDIPESGQTVIELGALVCTMP